MTSTITPSIPPQSEDAEKSVLGSLLIEPHVFDDFELRAEEFYFDRNERIYAAFGRLWNSGQQQIDAVILGNELSQAGDLDAVGGAGYLAELLNFVPHARHAARYAHTVRQKATLRLLIHACRETIQRAYIGDVEALEKLEAATTQIRDTTSGGNAIRTMSDAVEALELRETEPHAIQTTGLPSLDRMLTGGGFRSGQLIIVGGASGSGKSVLSAQFAAKAGNSLIVSLEMDAADIAERFTRQMSRDAVRRMPIRFVDSVFDASRIGSLIRVAQRKYGVRLAVVDYLQLVAGGEAKANRERQVAEVSRSLKQLAKELRIPIVAGCQINKDSAKEKRMPNMRDLRESSAIGHDADVVLLVHRDGDESKLIVGKQRNGPQGVINLNFIGHEFRFEDAQEQYTFGSDAQ